MKKKKKIKISKELHRKIKKLAKSEGISESEFIEMAIDEKIDVEKAEIMNAWAQALMKMTPEELYELLTEWEKEGEFKTPEEKDEYFKELSKMIIEAELIDFKKQQRHKQDNTEDYNNDI